MWADIFDPVTGSISYVSFLDTAVHFPGGIWLAAVYIKIV